MIDAVVLTLIFLAIFNPIAGVLLWKEMARYRLSVAPGFVAVSSALVSFLLLAIATLAGEWVLDQLDITPPSFQIATGVLLVVSSLFVFAPAREPAKVENGDGGRYWPVARMVLWLASPAALAAGIGYRIEFGVGSTLTGIAIALAISAVVIARAKDLLSRLPMPVMVWIGRFIGAAVIILAVDLIRRGVENV